MPSAAALEVEDLRKSFGTSLAVDQVSLRLEQGEFVSLVGPSGCGKSTILRMIAGLLDLDSGAIFVNGKEITSLPVHKRNIGFVFQSYALFPHLSVFENVAFGLRRRRVSEPDIRTRVARALDMVRLQGLETRRPGQLSGGQQQRVALARALITEPSLLLLDEPLSNLDALLRDEMRLELKRLQNQLGITTLFVTHDQAEALAMSDRVVVLNRGRQEQTGTPEEIYGAPASSFVAMFVGRSNFISGVVDRVDEEGAWVRCANDVRVLVQHSASFGKPELPLEAPVRLAIRQERVKLSKTAAPYLPNCFSATVALRSFAGSLQHYLVRLDGGIELEAEVPATFEHLQRGERIHVAWDPSDVKVLVEHS